MKMTLVIMALISTFSTYAMQRNKPLKALYSNIAAGDVERVLRYFGTISYITYKGMSPLHAAVNPYLRSGTRKDSVAAMVAVLIRKEASIEARDRFSFTPLAKAAREKDYEGVEALVQNGACVHVWDDCAYMTPLGYAVENDDFGTALMLLNAGASRDALIRDHYEWIGERQRNIPTAELNKRFVNYVASDRMKELFMNYQGPARSIPERDNDAVEDMRSVLAKKIKIAEEILSEES